jgi:hypothetical protein
MQADLQAVCPELLAITNDADNLWFLRFRSCRDGLTELARLRRTSLLKIPGIGKKYANVIQEWQKRASFSSEVEHGPDDRLRCPGHPGTPGTDRGTGRGHGTSDGEVWIARRLSTITSFGKTSVAELAGEIGTLDRFDSEASLALYLGMCSLSNQSGQFHGTKSLRQVNRRAKAAMMTTVARHIDYVPQSKAYYDKKRTEGKKYSQAVRALGRHLVRMMWSMIKQGRDYELRDPRDCP